MVRPRADNYEERKQEIADAAAAVFAEQGFDGSSISFVAQRCGVSKALLYHYFQSKEDLLYYMLKSHCQLLVECATSALRTSANPEKQLRSLIRELMQLYMNARDKHAVLLNNLKSLPENQQDEIRELEKRVVQSIKKLVGKLRPDLSEQMRTATAMYLMGAINFTYVWFKPQGPISARQYADLATSIFLEGIQRNGSGVR